MADLVPKKIKLHDEDWIKLEALAETYQLPLETITAERGHKSLVALEENMPYVPGERIIRVEEGDEIYEDKGPMTKYLDAIKKIRKNKSRQI